MISTKQIFTGYNALLPNLNKDSVVYLLYVIISYERM